MFPLYAIRPLLSAVTDSMSRWFIGWSISRKLAPTIIMRLDIQRTFSPPERTDTGLKTSSWLKSMRPRKERR